MSIRGALLIAALGAVLTSAPALAQQGGQPSPSFSGPAKAINGDTLEMKGYTVRLNGVDAHADEQTCLKAGKPVALGPDAKKALEALVAGKTVSCTAVSMDRQQRPIADCTVGGKSLQGALVATGYAYDYERFSKGAYKKQQDEAKAAKRGVWAAGLQCRAPWEWREN